MVKLYIPFKDTTDGLYGESVWAQAIGKTPDVYKLLNQPLSPGLRWGDRVVAMTDSSGVLTYIKKVKIIKTTKGKNHVKRKL